MTRARQPTATRRGVLAVLGSATLAGCGAIGGLLGGGETTTTLDGEQIAALAGKRVPSVPERVPVEIGGAHLDAVRARVDDLLGSVPVPLAPAEIPNEAIREKLQDWRRYATESLGEADEAATPTETMDALRNARAHARAVAAGWHAVETGFGFEELQAEAGAIRSEATDFRTRRSLLGDDPVRAVLVHAVIDDHLRRAEREVAADGLDLDRRFENPVSVGEIANDVETARASLDDATHLYERFTASSSDRRDLEGTFASAVENLRSTIETRREGLPEGENPSAFVEPDIEDTPAEVALDELHDEARSDYGIEEARSAGRPATVIVRAHETLAQLRAFAALRKAVNGGETFAVESVADVRAIRDGTIEAVNAVLSNPDHPDLTRYGVEDMAGVIAYVDDELARLDDEVEARWLDRELGDLVTATYTIEAFPAASDRVVSALSG